MITPEQYFQAKPHSLDQAAHANDLLTHVNRLCDEAAADGIVIHDCPNTGTGVSGSKGGQGDGGFRLPTSTTGAEHSSHKEGKGVDRYDYADGLDRWLSRFEGIGGSNSKLEEHGLWREHPDATPGWCHLTIRAPVIVSHRTFRP